MVSIISLIISLLSIVLLAALTIFTLRLSAHYNHLIKDVNKRSLQTLLEKILTDIDITKKDIDLLSKRCDTIMKEGQLHIQKIGLIRFNPFKETGGDQSFILAMVDGNDTGVVISGLYSRSGTRWYAKRILAGNGVEHDLSEDEKQAVREAKKISNEK